MTYDEMNQFILNYIRNDITGRAIMLSGGWGSGKSYYIRNSLKPFLEDKDNGGYKCIIVSLYGLSELSDISKAIYTELRSIRYKKHRELVATAKIPISIISKTVYNALISKIGYDIGKATERDLRKVYMSLDLSEKLVILEDVERSSISIKELFGYVYNMCDNDGAKVLLVSNEQDLAPYKIMPNKDTDGTDRKTIVRKEYTQDTLEYLKAKEKTVSDTIKFNSEFRLVVGEIIDNFGNEELNCYKSLLDIDTSKKLFGKLEEVNYREVILACQKTCDIFRFIKEHHLIVDDEFKKCIFIGLINYTQKRLKEPEVSFASNSLFDPMLSGNNVYPLVRFCFEYFNNQVISEEKIKEAFEGYSEYVIYVDKPTYDDKDLNVLYGYTRSTEIDLLNAVRSIYSRLDNVEDLSLYHYDRIINHLLLLKYDVKLKGAKIDESIEKMIENLKGRGASFPHVNSFFTSTIVIQDPEGKKAFSEIKTRVCESLASTANDVNVLSRVDLIKEISRIVSEDMRKYNSSALLEMIPVEKVKENIAKFESSTLDDLRHIIWQINIGELSDNDITAIVDLRDRMRSLKDDKEKDLDCIQRMQLDWICSAIDKKMEVLYPSNEDIKG